MSNHNRQEIVHIFYSYFMQHYNICASVWYLWYIKKPIISDRFLYGIEYYGLQCGVSNDFAFYTSIKFISADGFSPKLTQNGARSIGDISFF